MSNVLLILGIIAKRISTIKNIIGAIFFISLLSIFYYIWAASYLNENIFADRTYINTGLSLFYIPILIAIISIAISIVYINIKGLK
jgi:hypothetical protein